MNMVSDGKNPSEALVGLQLSALLGGNFNSVPLDDLERALDLDPRNFLTLQQLALTYSWQARYADQARILDRALAIVPGDPVTRITRAGVALDWRADIKPFQTTLAALVAEDPSVAPDVDDPDHALCERTPAAAARVLANDPREGVVNNGVNYPYAYWEGVVAHCQGDSAKAEAGFTAARKEVETTVEKQPDFATRPGGGIARDLVR